MKALILGKGKSGTAAAALLKAQGCEVDFADEYDCVVVSPGLRTKSELQLGCEELKRRGWKLLAVTGSKGKSSVVKLVADAIGGIPCGNYGRPVADLIQEKPGWAVVEVSSFQLETTTLPSDTFEAAAILNLQEDHLDRHGSVEAYHGLKRKLLSFAARNFVNEGMTSEHPSIGASEHLWTGSYFANEILAGNAAIAVELMRVAGLDDAGIAAAFKAFKPLPHRMNLVAEINGIRYIDDSKATSIAALIAGVKMATSIATVGVRGLETEDGRRKRRILLIAGGLPKGDDPKTALATLTERVKKVYLIGQSAEAFFAVWNGAVDCEICGTMDKAVEKAKCEAEKGETVLLSPGTASFDQFQSYGERGEVFARLVKKEGQPK